VANAACRYIEMAKLFWIGFLIDSFVVGLNYQSTIHSNLVLQLDCHSYWPATPPAQTFERDASGIVAIDIRNPQPRRDRVDTPDVAALMAILGTVSAAWRQWTAILLGSFGS